MLWLLATVCTGIGVGFLILGFVVIVFPELVQRWPR